jgi:endonuclease YncB( thermonuclease family)
MDLAEQLLRSGFAWHYKKYNDSEYLARLEEEARRNRIGLWRDPNPVPPWDQRAARETSEAE